MENVRWIDCMKPRARERRSNRVPVSGAQKHSSCGTIHRTIHRTIRRTIHRTIKGLHARARASRPFCAQACVTVNNDSTELKKTIDVTKAPFRQKQENLRNNTLSYEFI